MAVGVPGLLEKFSRAELKQGRRVLVLDNVSRRSDVGDRFLHVSVEGTLEVEVNSEGVIATANVKRAEDSVTCRHEPEKVKRMINSVYKLPINGANAYRPGSWITLYSYPYDGPTGWSFHCDLSRKP